MTELNRAATRFSPLAVLRQQTRISQRDEQSPIPGRLTHPDHAYLCQYMPEPDIRRRSAAVGDTDPDAFTPLPGDRLRVACPSRIGQSVAPSERPDGQRRWRQNSGSAHHGF